jgi:4-amino-4-deoxy-L-arabinose transferase-like glycosyltransferase
VARGGEGGPATVVAGGTPRRSRGKGVQHLWAAVGLAVLGWLPWAHLDEQCLFLINSNFQTNSNLQWFKTHLLLLKNFQIKYGFERFEERNNFLHRNFFRFEMDFK